MKKKSAFRLLPIFEPNHNFREICKQLVLLEDHLCHPRKRCQDCIRKHFVTAEALAEEAVSLAGSDGRERVLAGALSETLRNLGVDYAAKRVSSETTAAEVRKIRKPLLKMSYSHVVETRKPRGSRKPRSRVRSRSRVARKTRSVTSRRRRSTVTRRRPRRSRVSL